MINRYKSMKDRLFDSREITYHILIKKKNCRTYRLIFEFKFENPKKFHSTLPYA